MNADLVQIGDGSCLDSIFEAAVDIVQNMPKKGPISISISQKLRLYSLFKQGTIGNCNIPPPPLWYAVERLKWSAWNSLGSLESQKAKQIYIEEFKGIIDRIQCEYDIAELARGSDEQTKQLLKIKLPILGYDLNDLKSEADLNSFRRSLCNTAEEGRGMEKNVSESDAEGLSDEYVGSVFSSDEEYVDAVDCTYEPHVCFCRHSRNQREDHLVGNYVISSMPEAESVNDLSTVMHLYLKALINLLTYIRRLLSRCKRSIRSRWKMTLFVIIWPFIANFAMFYLYNRLTRC